MNQFKCLSCGESGPYINFISSDGFNCAVCGEDGDIVELDSNGDVILFEGEYDDEYPDEDY